MNIHEYQAKRIFKKFGIAVPNGIIAYTPNEALEAAKTVSEDGPWVVKAQIQSGARDLGKFTDKRAGKKGGIRLSKTAEDVFFNADDMLENMLITNQTGSKGRLVSRVYVEEFIKVSKKFYIGLTVDRASASVMLVMYKVAGKGLENIVDLSVSDNIFRINLGLQREITLKQSSKILDFMNADVLLDDVKSFIDKLLNIFYAFDATILEIDPIGISKNRTIWALDAKISFDKNALYRHKDIKAMSDDGEIEERELVASKYGFQYKELDSGIGIIVNGDGLALNTINEAKKLGMDTACFLNLKGGVDRDKITASIKLIMTNPKVDGIFINILGGFLRCNLIADGIINVANDLGLNIPLIVRFEGTNRDEATEILEKSNLSLLIAEDTVTGLNMLKKSIEEDL